MFWKTVTPPDNNKYKKTKGRLKQRSDDLVFFVSAIWLANLLSDGLVSDDLYNGLAYNNPNKPYPLRYPALPNIKPNKTSSENRHSVFRKTVFRRRFLRIHLFIFAPACVSATPRAGRRLWWAVRRRGRVGRRRVGW
ncbi:hypothetical protein CYK00_09485 [Neisseria sicca]|uniref:Uncharacterized protein n=1 Tax=Neisseria sicca TaxID=490 RepID=A0A2I1XAE7_NEISI|nr:hypothetical protein CYK00_09485 [Neisseria sicca]